MPTPARVAVVPQEMGQPLRIEEVELPDPGPFDVAVLVGIPTAPPDVDIGDLLMHEKHLTGSIGGTSRPERDFPIFMDWYRQGILDLESLVTQRFALDETNDAVDALENGRIAGRSILVFD